MGGKYIASPLNYIGGKYKLLSQILPLFPKDIRIFVDLFCGGCNVGINVDSDIVVFNDNLVYLIDLYKAFNDNSQEEIINYIENRIQEFNLSLTNQNGYLKLRDTYNHSKEPLDLFVLIAYSFNHQIRFNSSHQFNNPFGKERSSFNPRMKSNLLNFIGELKRKKVEFYSNNFDELDLSKLDTNDFVYADPPYLITRGTYNDGKRGFTGWNEETEEKLLTLLDSLNDRGVKFALSNVIEHNGKSNEMLKKWLENNNYIINYLDKDYSNCNYHITNKNKNSSIEVLITNYNPNMVENIK